LPSAQVVSGCEGKGEKAPEAFFAELDPEITAPPGRPIHEVVPSAVELR
jgi:hypothetical protein